MSDIDFWVNVQCVGRINKTVFESDIDKGCNIDVIVLGLLHHLI